MLNSYTDIIKNIGSSIDQLSAQEIKALLKKGDVKIKENAEIDFLAFFKNHVEGLKAKGKYWKTFNTCYNALDGFLQGDILFATAITSSFLASFERYLLETKEKPKNDKVKNVGVHNVMRELRTVFNLCVAEYNDEDTGKIVIPNNPYKKYKLPNLKNSDERGRLPQTCCSMLSFPFILV